MIKNYASPANDFLVIGKILPERKSFSHSCKVLFLKNEKIGLDVKISLSVVNNQFVAKVTGNLAGQSNAAIKDIVYQAERNILDSHAFVTGSLFDLDIVSILPDPGKTQGSIEHHYMENVHDAIANRKPKFDINDLLRIIESKEGGFLNSCLTDLKNALQTQPLHTPFYCYRAIEIINNHFANRCGIKNEAKQWDCTRECLEIEKQDIFFVKDFADKLRHGDFISINFSGAEWRKVIEVTWGIVEKYISFLMKILDGKQEWPKSKEAI